MCDLRKLVATAGAAALVASSTGAHADAASPRSGFEAMMPLMEMQVAVLSPVFANLCITGVQGCVLPLRERKLPGAVLPGSPPPPVAPPPVAAGGAAAAASGGGLGSYWLLGVLAALAGVGVAAGGGNGNAVTPDSPGG